MDRDTIIDRDLFKSAIIVDDKGVLAIFGVILSEE